MGDRVGVELFYNWVEFESKSSCQQTPRELETRCGRESHTRPRGSSETPDGVRGPEKMLIRCHKESQYPAVDPKTSRWASKRTRKTQRDGHNSGVKIWSLCSVSSILSQATLKQPFRTLAIKWEVNIIVKKSSCFLSSCVFLCASVFTIIESLWYGRWLYNKRPSVNAIRKNLKESNRKVPGHDGIHGFWFKKFTSIHGRLALEMNRCLQTAQVPECITKGKSKLIQKDPSKRTAPNNYRPITYLSMMWNTNSTN